MRRLRPYISILLLALLVFPVADKAIHEFGHLNEVHCNIHEKHYCAAEHTCSLCDFVFSSSVLPPVTDSQSVFFQVFSAGFNAVAVHNYSTPHEYSFRLRGPPSVVVSA